MKRMDLYDAKTNFIFGDPEFDSASEKYFFADNSTCRAKTKSNTAMKPISLPLRSIDKRVAAKSINKIDG